MSPKSQKKTGKGQNASDESSFEDQLASALQNFVENLSDVETSESSEHQKDHSSEESVSPEMKALVDSMLARLERRLELRPLNHLENAKIESVQGEGTQIFYESWLVQGPNALEPVITGFRTYEPECSEDFVPASNIMRSAEKLSKSIRSFRSPGFLRVHGLAFGEEHALAQALAKLEDYFVIYLDESFADCVFSQLSQGKGATIKDLLAMAKPIVFFDLRKVAEGFYQEKYSLCLQALCKTDVVVLASDDSELPPQSWFDHQTDVTIEDFSLEESTALWKKELTSSGIDVSDDLVHQIASFYTCTPREIRSLLQELKQDLKKVEDPHDILKLLQSRSTGALDRLAQRVTPRYRFSDIVLPAHVQAQFVEAYRYILTMRHCKEVFGFAEKHTRGHGANLLFRGPSGTGKTMAAEVLANELGVNLYRVDLSRIVSKYIGETEKNLRAIFAAARRTQGVLLFDEGDALFGKRQDAQSSTDRYANMEINVLLQELEGYDGISILTTNLGQAVDDAFRRRFQFDIEFPKPTAETRKDIFKATLPSNLPLSDDIDWDHLSKFDLSGGGINKVARIAAAFAAFESRSVKQVDFLLAIRREYERMGYSISREDFGDEHWKAIAPEWDDQRYRKHPELLNI